MKMCLGLCYRLRHLFFRSPYSVFDLSISIGVLFIGFHLFLFPELFYSFDGLYIPMSMVMDQFLWAIIFIVCGGYGLVIVLWPNRPVFALRLLARMCISFCLMSFALNNLSSYPPPMSGIMYSVLSVFSIWSIVRVRCDG